MDIAIPLVIGSTNRKRSSKHRVIPCMKRFRAERPKSVSSKLDWLEIEVRRLSAENWWNHEARRLLVEGRSTLSTVESDVVKLSTDIVSTRQEVEYISAMTTNYLCAISCDLEEGNEISESKPIGFSLQNSTQ